MTARVVTGLALAILLGGCADVPAVNGVPNLQRLRENYYRSGQPQDTPGAWGYLRSLGITDVFKLDFEDEGTDEGAATVGIAVHHLAIDPTSSALWWAASFGLGEFFRPDGQTMDRVKRLVREVRGDGRGRVVLIHCKHGRDRTGLVSGLVLVMNGDMTKSEAWQYVERTGFRSVHVGLVREWDAFDPAREVW